MTSERWRRITEVFHLAQGRDFTARTALLDEACGDDAALRAEVEAMLAADAAAAHFGDTPLFPSPDAAPQFEAGACLGPYQIKTLIGAGGMGEVYRAHDARLDRDIAIKVLSATASSDANARLLREARSAAALNHPYVCTIYEVGETDGHAYIVMELIEGKPLDRLIPAGGFPLEDIVRYGGQIADAIAHAHERGIVHRDLKPANVMISDSGIAKVLDFGLAKVLPFAEQPHLDSTVSRSLTGVVIGTAAYMSPEQALGHSTDVRSDIFSFGGVLYEMATGRPAFTGATPMEVLDAVLHATPEPVSAIRRDLSLALSQVIETALAKNLADRYQHMSEATLELRRLERPAPRPWVKATAMTSAAAVVAAVIWVGVPAGHVRPNVAPAPVSIDDVTAGKARVAVLPFENLTRHADDDWLAAAFSDSLTAGLQSLDSLILVSRNGIAQAYQEQGLREPDRLASHTIDRLSRTLGFRHYVHGSYQRIGDEIRVVARLVEMGSGTIKAQESVTENVANLLQLEDVLARRFAASLESGHTLATERPQTTSLAAYRAVTEGRGLYTSSRWQETLELSQRAIDLDPEYAGAWALLAKSYARLTAPSVFAGGPRVEYRSRSLAAAARAVELDPSSYEAHVALALAHRESAQVEPWRAAARKAISLNSRLAEGYALLGDSYAETPAWSCGRDRDTRLTVSYYSQALRIDPTVIAYHFNLTNYLRYGGRAEEALRVADEGLRIHPTSLGIQRIRAYVLIDLDRIDEAERILRQIIAVGVPPYEELQVHLAAIDLKRGRLDAAANGFRKVATSRIDIARRYLTAGIDRPAVNYLERALRNQPACAHWLLTTQSPFWAPVRANPHTRALLEKYNASEPSR